MKRLLALLFLIAAMLPAADFEVARPGYEYRFPRDHFSHPGFKTEWWYYTGNLRSAAGRRFGYELTFFRQAASREPRGESVWRVDDIYMAHLALTDVDGRKFYHAERLNRAGPGLAGVDASESRIWNGNWRVKWEGDVQRLQAVDENFTLNLSLRALKAPVIHGKDGVSRKAAGEGRASHYISLTRIETRGELLLNGDRHELSGTSWMDHEFFTHQLDEQQTGWDWLSLQFEDGSELMLFRLRRKDGAADRHSAGTFVDPQGRARHLEASDFSMQRGALWRSPATGARYPIEWSISIFPLSMDLRLRTPLESQELVSRSGRSPNYWEGTVVVEGRGDGKPVRGAGYLEMTGYDREVNLSR